MQTQILILSNCSSLWRNTAFPGRLRTVVLVPGDVALGERLVSFLQCRGFRTSAPLKPGFVAVRVVQLGSIANDIKVRQLHACTFSFRTLPPSILDWPLYFQSAACFSVTCCSLSFSHNSCSRACRSWSILTSAVIWRRLRILHGSLSLICSRHGRKRCILTWTQSQRCGGNAAEETTGTPTARMLIETHFPS